MPTNLGLSGLFLGDHAAPQGGSSGLAPAWSETWPGIAGAAFPVAWTTLTGTGRQDGLGSADFTNTAGKAIRDGGRVNGTFTVSLNAVAGSVPIFIFRSDNTRNTFNYLIWDNGGTQKLQYTEQTGGVPSGTVTGTAVIAVGNTYAITIALNGSSVIIKVAGVTDITATATLGLSNTWEGIQEAGTGFGMFGPLSFT